MTGAYVDGVYGDGAYGGRYIGGAYVACCGGGGGGVFLYLDFFISRITARRTSSYIRYHKIKKFIIHYIVNKKVKNTLHCK